MDERHKLSKAEIAAGYDAITDKIGLDERFYDQCIAVGGDCRGKVLDIGCGRGRLLQKLATRFGPSIEAHGLDLSPKLCEIAKQSNPDAEIVVGDAENLPYSDEYFDHVFMTEALEHMLDFDRAVSEARRVLKGGGTFVVSVPNRDWASYDFYDKIRDHSLQPVDDHYFRFEEISNLLKKNSFSITKYKGLDNLFYYGWKHRIEEIAAQFIPSLNKKMKRLVFLCIKK